MEGLFQEPTVSGEEEGWHIAGYFSALFIGGDKV